ncbi:MAG: thiamine pyrophosphate-dependent dehydrogenase E1 component subunit alpha [Spirochaetales bacterium]|nr:thiamine pyrophosphate-dependent dehydrogenase E1 component subunit alpha [Spirochaetales bacterium]
MSENRKDGPRAAQSVAVEPERIPLELLKRMYRQLYTIRVFETRCMKLYRSGDIRGYLHPYLGEEAIAVGTCAALEERDYIVSTHRGHGHCIARGAGLERMVAEIIGRETGYCRGRGGSMHIADFDTGNLGANGIVGGGIPLGVGAALGTWVRGEDRVTVIFFSDGASNNGVFAESLNLAAIYSLPAVFVLENNRYAAQTPVETTSRLQELYRRGLGYGVESWGVDGNDLAAVYASARRAVELCRSGQGPVLIEARTYRHQGHHVNDPGSYMPQEELEFYKSKKDPVALTRAALAREVDEKQIAALERAVDQEMEEAVEFARRSPEPDVQEFLREVEALQ